MNQREYWITEHTELFSQTACEPSPDPPRQRRWPMSWPVLGGQGKWLNSMALGHWDKNDFQSFFLINRNHLHNPNQELIIRSFVIQFFWRAKKITLCPNAMHSSFPFPLWKQLWVLCDSIIYICDSNISRYDTFKQESFWWSKKLD